METITVRNDKQRFIMSGYFSIIAFLIITTVLIIPFMVVYFFENGLTQLDPNKVTFDLLLPSLIVTFAAEIILIFLMLLFTHDLRNWRSVLGLEHFRWKTFLLGPAIGAGFFIGLLLLTALFKTFGVDVADSETSAQFASLDGAMKIFVLIIAVPILAPILEELLFRGLILNHLLRGHGAQDKPLKTPIVVWCITYSSLCFSAVHFQGASSAIDFVVLGWTFLFAVVSCVLRIKTRSIYPSMGAHSVYNGASAASLFVS